MKLDSKYFDGIRVKPKADGLAKSGADACEWPGCKKAGKHRAPRGRGRENEYHTFCVDHVRQYNQSYDYFTGMKDEEVVAFQSDARSGHRPTWKMGENAAARGQARARKAGTRNFDPLMGRVDPFGLFGETESRGDARPRRSIRNAERKALSALGLDESASAGEVKTRYKTLVKKYHPDANGGRRDSDDRFREIVQAYDYLKSVDFC